MSETRVLKVVIVGNSSQATAAFKSLAAESDIAGTRVGSSFEAMGKKFDKIGSKLKSYGSSMTHLFTVPVVAGAVASVDMATKFNAAMTRVQTQAGASAKDVQVLSKQILDLGGSVQQGPVELANAMYHLKSVGMDNAQAMKALAQSSHLAAVGGTDLEQTTNAIAGAWRTGIKGANNFSQAAGLVNATVGAGNMKMEDYVNALGTGLLPAAKLAGLSLRDVGGAMALFTDENVPASSAATRLGTALSLMAAPGKAAEKVLNGIGLSGKQIGEAMQKPNGLVGALTMIKSHLKGLDKATQFADLSHAFGGARGAKTVMSMINNLDVLKGKMAQVGANAGKFGAAIAAQAKTPEATFKELKSTIESVGVKLGNQLLPYFIKAAKGLSGLITKFQNLNPTVQKFVGIAVLVAAAIGPVLLIAGALATAIGALMSPVGAVVAAIAGLAIAFGFLYAHSKMVRDTVGKVWNSLKGAFESVANTVKSNLLPAFHNMLPILKPIGEFLVKIFGSTIMGLIHGVENVVKGVIKVFSGLMNFISGVFTGNWSRAWKGIKQIFFGLLQGIWGAIEIWWNGSIIGAFRHGLVGILEIFTGGWKGLVKLAKGGVEGLNKMLSKVWEFVTSPFRRAFNWVKGFVESGWAYIKGEFSGGVGGVRGIISRIVEVVTYPYREAWSIAKSIVTNGWSIVKGLFSRGVATVRSIITQVPSVIKGAFSGAVGWLKSAGEDVLNGLIQGLDVAKAWVQSKISAIANMIPAKFKALLGIHSPSRVMYTLSKYVIQGITKGLTDSKSLKDMQKSLEYVRTKIRDAFHDKHLNAGQRHDLLTMIDVKSKRIKAAVTKQLALADHLKKANDKLKAAQDALNNDKQARDSLAQNIASQSSSTGQLSAVWGDGTDAQPNNAGALLYRLQARLAAIKGFASNLNKLASAHLSNSLLNQIAEQGPDVGNQMALSLLGDPSLIRSLNATDSSITATSNAIGVQAGQRTYGAAIAKDQAQIHRDKQNIVHVNVEVKGNVTAEKDLAKSIASEVRSEIERINKRNGSKTKTSTTKK